MKAKKRSGIIKNVRGFTLMELMVVIVILGILAGTVYVNYVDYVEEAKVTKTETDISTLDGALRTYRMKKGAYPPTEQGLQALLVPSAKGMRFLEKLPKDSWGNDFVYLNPGPEGREYVILSYGKDGMQGGDGFDADISNWEIE